MTSTVGDAGVTDAAEAAATALFAAAAAEATAALAFFFFVTCACLALSFGALNICASPGYIVASVGFAATAMRNSGFTRSSSVIATCQAMASSARTYVSHTSVGPRSARQPIAAVMASTTEEAAGVDVPSTVT